MKKRVLIISYYFAPQNTIGAVRPTKFAKYLTRMGYDVTVICGVGMNRAEDPTLKRDMAELEDVHVIREWNPIRTYKEHRKKRHVVQNAATEQGGKESAGDREQGAKGILHNMVDVLYVYLRVLSDRSFGRLAKRELHKLYGTYDAVFSTYSPISVHEVAHRAKQMGLAKRWFADFRDEVNVSFSWQDRKRYMQMIRKDADVLSAVSGGFLDMMGIRDAGRVLSNGFDAEDIGDVSILETDDIRKLRIVYCGQLRTARKNLKDRDITPFFRALRHLINEGVLDENEISLIFAGDEGDLFTNYAAALGLQKCVQDQGLVSRERSLALQKNADMLLMASWNQEGQTGILTGKLFEYMMMDKPIVCCMAGDLQGSELAHVLNNTGLGICYEEANAQEDERALVQYLYILVAQWRQGKSLLMSKNNNEIERFSYANLTSMLAAWIDDEV